MILRQPIGDGLETEAGVAFEPGFDVGEAYEARVDVLSDEESDVDVGETEEFGEFEHGVHWALEG